jgi:hypothetical protein
MEHRLVGSIYHLHCLFVIGKFLLGLYFAEVNPTSAYGVASTIIFILLWVSYSCVIVFFGAQFTWVFSKRYGIGIQPKSNAFLEKTNNNKRRTGTKPVLLKKCSTLTTKFFQYLKQLHLLKELGNKLHFPFHLSES